MVTIWPPTPIWRSMTSKSRPSTRAMASTVVGLLEEDVEDFLLLSHDDDNLAGLDDAGLSRAMSSIVEPSHFVWSRAIGVMTERRSR